MSTAEARVPLPANVSEDEFRLAAAIKLFELKRISLGEAATLAGYSVRAFIDVLARHSVPVINYSPEELESELES